MNEKPTLPRFEIIFENEITADSWKFETQLRIPRIGESVTIYDVDNDGAELLSGRVVDIRWAYTNASDDPSCFVVIRPE